jgi:ribosome maturation factor RimP
MNTVDLQREVRELIEPTVERLGFDLVGVQWLGGAYGRVLRLSIGVPGGITAHHCAQVSDHVSPLLDQADPIETRYTLEVSSPGINRPVQRVADFQRFAGYTLKLRLMEGIARRRYTGQLESCDSDELTIVVDGREHRVALDTIEQANLVLTLDEYQALSEVDHDDQ